MTRTLPLLLGLLAHATAQVDTVADPFSPLREGHTAVWSPLFQAAWDEMNHFLGGKPTKVEPPNVMMTRLDTFSWKPQSVMPKSGWKAWAGMATSEFLKQVNTEAVRITGANDGPFNLTNPNPKRVAIFALLDRKVEFQQAFFRSRKEPLLFGNDHQPVQFFGTRGDQANQYTHSVEVLSYRPARRSHALEVSCMDSDDKLILYQPEKPQGFATACRWLKHWRLTHKQQPGGFGKWNDGRLHPGDDVRIPYLTLNTTKDFNNELRGRRYHSTNNTPWVIERAEQKTRFRLHEKGADVRVEFSSVVGPFGGDAFSDPIPRQFFFDRPFFAFLWRDNADWPYLGIWVGDSSAMHPME